MTSRVAILFSGRGSNMQAIVREAQQGMLVGFCIPVMAVCNNPRAPGMEIAQSMGVPTSLLSSRGIGRDVYDQRLLDLLEPHALDWIVLAGFSRILGPKFIARYRNRVVNIHPADSRQFQGLGGYEWAWQNRLERTWITVHLVDEGVDTGRILAQAEVSLDGVHSLDELEMRGLRVEHALYSRVLRDLFCEPGSAQSCV